VFSKASHVNKISSVHLQTGEGTSQDNAPLHVDDNKEPSSGLPLPSNTNFANPLFKDEDLE